MRLEIAIFGRKKCQILKIPSDMPEFAVALEVFVELVYKYISKWQTNDFCLTNLLFL